MSTQMNPAQARVIDPILTEVARGYRSNKSPVANVLFPVVQVGQRGGRIMTFGPEDFKLVDTARAPGAATKRVQSNYGSETFSLRDHSLEGEVPVELIQEADAVPGLSLAAMAVRKVINQMALEREKQAADLARNAASYGLNNKLTLSGTSQWSHASSDPFTDIIDAKESVRGQIGMRPNVLTVSPKAITALRTHAKVLDRLSTASDRPPATLAQLAQLFELDQIVEAEMVYHDGTSFVDVWGTDALLAYTAPAGMHDYGSPNFGYTYQLRGHPYVEEPYLDRSHKTWFYPHTDSRQVVLAGPSAGFLFINAAA